MHTQTVALKKKKGNVWAIGLAMFAMFFGAGNIVFPLALGQFAQDKNFYGIVGMMFTAVFIPLAGLLAMLFFEGDYNAFFRRIGKIPGFLVTLMILGLIGPFAGIPRCITISYSTLSTFGLDQLPGFNLATFSVFSCLLIFFFTYRPSKILPLLGYVLTPLLLVTLAVILLKGALVMPAVLPSSHTGWQTFVHGFMGGYNMMDLLASFFFSSVVLLCLKRPGEQLNLKENRPLLYVAISGCLIAATLLTLVYVSFSYLSAGYSAVLEGVPKHELLGTLAYLHLGPYAGLIAGTAVAFACLTTEIALAAILAEFLRKTLCKEKISYPLSLLIILGLSFFVSTLKFDGISAFLGPILELCYPALIVLTLLNLAHKIFNFKPVKTIVYGTFALTVILYFSL